MKYLVVNAFPRSGSVFFASALNMIKIQGDVMMASLHIPHIIDNDRINTAVILRNPYDALSSHSYMRYIQSSKKFKVEEESESIKFHLDDYMEYIKYVKENKNKEFLYVVDFDKMIKDPMGEIISLCHKFGFTYQNKIINNQTILSEVKNNLSRNSLMDDAQGHMPREKNEERLKIEEFIRSLSFIDEAYQEYFKILNT